MKENQIRNLIGSLGVIALVVVVVLVLFSSSDNKGLSNSNKSLFSKEDVNRPIAKISENNIVWGEINVNDTKESIVELKNDGKSSLEITRISTSCGCTSVKALLPDGKETIEYSMHKTSEKITIEPSNSIKLKITYKPFTMPVEGAVSRQVFLETNDPNNEKITINASAVVKK